MKKVKGKANEREIVDRKMLSLSIEKWKGHQGLKGLCTAGNGGEGPVSVSSEEMNLNSRGCT